MRQFDNHVMPLGYFGRNQDTTPSAFFFWGQHNYNDITFKNLKWSHAQSGAGTDKVSYSHIKGVDSFSDISIVILEGSPENSIERWYVDGTSPSMSHRIAGSGNSDDRFNNPIDVTVSDDDKIYVVDILSTGHPRVKVFSAEFESLGGFGDNTTIQGTPIACDWDDSTGSIHILTTTGVSVLEGI